MDIICVILVLIARGTKKTIHWSRVDVHIRRFNALSFLILSWGISNFVFLRIPKKLY